MEKIKKFLLEEEGVTAVEYGLIAGLLSVLIIGGLQVGGPALGNIFTNIGNHLVEGAANSQ
ncbi:Flp family type IVb pilin [Desulfogranum mediterraneum]|uniref:Flp family type IVb pilin n=1 Tax=Desulfogranum mediterraneum TaxID=160661 RepID=UPI0004904731|nr:Flp family type IVb pilin [Desulfogranum mediterraneum]